MEDQKAGVATWGCHGLRRALPTVSKCVARRVDSCSRF